MIPELPPCSWSITRKTTQPVSTLRHFNKISFKWIFGLIFRFIFSQSYIPYDPPTSPILHLHSDALYRWMMIALCSPAEFNNLINHFHFRSQHEFIFFELSFPSSTSPFYSRFRLAVDGPLNSHWKSLKMLKHLQKKVACRELLHVRMKGERKKENSSENKKEKISSAHSRTHESVET